MRIFNDALSTQNKGALVATLRLARAYISALSSGDHFRSIARLCDDLLPLIPDVGFEEQKAYLRFAHARGLRMSDGTDERPRDILQDIVTYEFPKVTRQAVLLNLALCHQSLGENEEAIAVAQKIVDLDAHSSSALQAQSIIVELKTRGAKRLQDLEELERLCRKENAMVVANNIAID
jgi:tetratricopeptide (TPR) repeat protein